jgi:hypothetical protein
MLSSGHLQDSEDEQIYIGLNTDQFSRPSLFFLVPTGQAPE